MYKLLPIGYTINRTNKSTENLYISNSYQRSLNPIDTRFFTASHLLQGRVTWEHALCLSQFPVLTIQSFYNVRNVHNPADAIQELEKISKNTDLFTLSLALMCGKPASIAPTHQAITIATYC